MSEENVERVRQVFQLVRNRNSTAEGAGFGRRELTAAADIFHPDFELDTTRAPMPDLRGKFRGVADVLDLWDRWLEAWDSLEFDAELTDAGEHVLATITRQVMRGKSSGIEIEFPPYWQGFTFRDGRIVSQVFFSGEAEALEAAGLSG